MIKIDGSFCEGGGQILRTALALSALTQTPFEVNDIRKGRCSPGLKNQHLFCVNALQDLCNAEVEGNSIGSTYLRFKPNKISGKTISINIETAGSITLLLQSVLLPSFFADKKVRLKITGGTDVKWSQPIDYFKEVLLPQLNKYANIEFKLINRGYYPKGNGKADVKIKPKFCLKDFKDITDFRKALPKINLMEQGNLIQVKGISHASIDLEKAQVAERQKSAAKLILSKLTCPIDIKTEYSETLSTGSGITLWAIFSKDEGEIDFVNPIRIGTDCLGEKGKRAEEVGKNAAERLINEINYKAPVDEYLADNLIPFLALNGKQIKIAKISSHTLTNIHVAEQFFGKIFDIDKINNIISLK